MAYFSSSPPQAAHQHPYAHHNVFGVASSSPFGSSSAASLKPPPAAAAGPTARSHNNSSNNSLSSGSHPHHSGELSPGLDQTFQSSMNISFADGGSPTGNSAGHNDQHQPYLQHALLAASTASSVAPSSPSAMEVSPAPPSRQQHSQQPSMNPLPSKGGILAPAFPTQPQRPALSPLVQPSKSAQDAATRSFDHSFFSKLAAHDSSSSRSSSSSSSTSSSSSSSYTSACSNVTATARTRTRSADVPLSSKDANIPSPTLGGNTFVFGAGNNSKEAAAATLPLKRPSGLLRASSARPSLFSAHSAIAEYPPRTSSVGAAASPFEGSPRPTAQLERAHSDNALSLGGSFPSRQKDAAGGSINGRKPSRLANEVDLSCSETIATSASSLSSASSSLFGSVRPPYPGSHTSSSATSVSTVTSGQGTSQGRRISGTTRVRSALPKEWQQQQTQSTGELQPPQLLHAHSAPLIRPAGLSALQQKANSESNLPTRRSLGTEGGSRLAHEILPACSSSSPSGMDVDPSSPHVRSIAHQHYAQATGSPGLGDLFAEGGAELALSSPSFQDGQQVVVSRKRAMQDADSSFSSAMSSSPVASATSGTLLGLADPAFDSAENFGNNGSSSKYATIGASIGKGHPPRLLHRATSALALGAASRRRGSGVQSGNSSFLASLAAVAGPDDHTRDSSQQHLQQQRNSLTLSGTTLLARENSGSTRHRKMSRGADGRPHLLRAGRRSQSMCDSEFYASPPLAANDGTQAKDYFAPQVIIAPMCGSSAAVGGDEVEEVLSEDVLSPPRKVPALNAYQPSPEASFSCGFGHKEAQGKILPCFPVKEDGLMRITADTLNDLLSGTYDEHIDQYVIIDCRFDYEYQGGHIEGAINLGTQKAVERFLLRSGGNAYEDCLYQRPEEMPLPSKSGEADQSGHCKKTILVFHCEFSAKRAPTLAKSLRSKDRALNHAAYPAVHFPELYVLQGGYAECFSKHPERCEPCGYVRMDDPRHLAARANDLGELRRKRIGVRAKSYTFGEGMFAAKQAVPQPKHLSGIAFKPAASSSLATASFTAGANSQSTSGSTSSTGTANNAANKARGSFGSNLFNVIGSSKLCIHEEEHDDDEHGHSSSAEGDNSFSNTKHGQLGNDNSSPCGPMMGSSSAAFIEMSIGDSPCQSGKPSKFGRQGLMSAQTASAAQHLFRPRGLQRASTTTGALF